MFHFTTIVRGDRGTDLKSMVSVSREQNSKSTKKNQNGQIERKNKIREAGVKNIIKERKDRLK